MNPTRNREPAFAALSLPSLALPRVFAITVPDAIVVGAAGAILVGIGLLQRSLGDVVQEEAQLPPAAGAAARRQSQRSKRFLKKNPRNTSSNDMTTKK